MGVDDETYRVWADRGELVTRDGTTLTDARRLAGQIGLVKAVRKYRLRRVISFHSRVKTARNFSGEVPDVIAWMPNRVRPPGLGSLFMLAPPRVQRGLGAGSAGRRISPQLGEGFAVMAGARWSATLARWVRTRTSTTSSVDLSAWTCSGSSYATRWTLSCCGTRDVPCCRYR